MKGSGKYFFNRSLLHGSCFCCRPFLTPVKGKVAMVSGWKAGVKEAVDVETGSGKVLKGVDLQALVEQAEKVPIVKEEGEKTQPAAAKSQPQSQPPPEFTFDPRIPGVDAALHSPKFLEEALDPKYFAVFQSVGVRTPVELFSAVKRQGSPLAIAVAKILPDPTNFELTIFDLCQIVRKKLSGIRRVNSNKRKPDDDEHEGAPATAKAKLDNTLLNGPPKEAVSRAKKEELQKKDPFYSLSAVTQTFLASMGIATAEGFLSTRTTDLSNAFVEWRAANDMPVLKGLGAIASVSGWKAQVRKIAKERGMEELALMVPEGSASYTPGKKRKSKDGSATNKKLNRAKLESGSSADPGKRMIAHPGVLFGKPSQRILVESTNGTSCLFVPPYTY